MTACFLLLALGVSLASYIIILNKEPSTPTTPNNPQEIEDNPELSYAEKIAKSYTCTFYNDNHHIISLEKDCTFILKNREIVVEKGSFSIIADGSISLSLFGEIYLLKPNLNKSLMVMLNTASGDYTEYSNIVGEYTYKLRLYNEGYARFFAEGKNFDVYGRYTKDGEKCTLVFLSEESTVALYKENGANKYKDYEEYLKSFYLGDYECSFMNNATLTLTETSFRIHNGVTLFEGNSYELKDDELCLYIGTARLYVNIYSDNGKKADLKDITEGEGESYTYYSKTYNEDYRFTFYPANGTYKMTASSMGYTLYGYYKVFSANRYYIICLKNSGMVVLDSDGRMYLASEYVEEESEDFFFEHNVSYKLSLISKDFSFTLIRKTENGEEDEHKGSYTVNAYGVVLSNTYYGIFRDKIIVLDYENKIFKLIKYYQYTDIDGNTYSLQQRAIDDDTDEFILLSQDNQTIVSTLVDRNTLKEGFWSLYDGAEEYLIWLSGNSFVYAESLLGKYYYNNESRDYLVLERDLSYEMSFNGNIERGSYSIIDKQIVLDNTTYITLSYNRFSFTKDKVILVECTLPSVMVKGEHLDLSKYTITLHTLLGNAYQSLLSDVTINGLNLDVEGEGECSILFRDYTYFHVYTVLEEVPSYLTVVNLPDTITLGDGINYANTVVNVISDLGRIMYSSVIDEGMFEDLDLTSIGNKSATLKYMGLTYTYEYTVVSEVYDVEIVGLTMPKYIFTLGEELDLSGAKIRIRTNLNSFRYEQVTLDMLVGFSTSKVGNGVFNIEYNGMKYVGGPYTVKAIPQSYELTVDVVLTTSAGVESDITYMTNAYFIALTEGKYRFESNSKYGIRVYLYDENMNLLAYDYSGHENSIDFVIEYSLREGEKVKLYYRVDSDQNEEIELIVTRIGDY